MSGYSPKIAVTPSERWRRLEDLFHEASERPTPRRADFLAEACGDDESLRVQVEELLVTHIGVDTRADRVVRGVLAEAAGGHGEPDLAVPRPSEPERRRIGPYRILHELGRGGMGTVYLAERADGQYEQRVAVKVVRHGMDDDAVLHRLRRERQILAGLEHPNIARLLDGGATDDGLPYFVLDYIEGEPIDCYCDRQRLSVGQRLALFRQVCGAVQHAHQNLVVHCDLKPSNILVTAEGVPRLLDFGIARLLRSELSPQTAGLTVTGERLLTPICASPEQVLGRSLTTATDIYSLGVLLYQLLTGALPYHLESGRLSEIERVICEVEPPRRWS